MTSELAMSGEIPAPVQAGPDDGTGVEVTVARGALIGLLLKNLVLTILTLGIYRFWARTHVRRRLWSSVAIQGEPLVYTGRAKELLIGFLLALIILVPVMGVFGFISALTPPNTLTHLIVNLGTLVFFSFLGLMAVYFARRYLLSRTAWRGIHAGQTGSFTQFIGAHLKFYLPSVLTLGLMLPWSQAKVHNYRAGITYFGTAQFSADAKPAGLWGPYLLAWGLVAAAYIGFISSFWPLFIYSMQMQAAQEAGEPLPPLPDDIMPAMGGMGAFMYLALLVPAALVFFHYNCRMWGQFITSSRLGAISFRLSLPTARLLYIPIVALVVLAVLIAIMVGAFTGFTVGADSGDPAQGFKAFLAIVAATVVFFVAINLLSVAWVMVEMMKAVGRYLRIDNIDAVSDIFNRGRPAPRRGEGMADALGDIGI